MPQVLTSHVAFRDIASMDKAEHVVRISQLTSLK